VHITNGEVTLNQEYLQSILDYNKDTGVFTWKHRDDVRPEWNTKFAGKEAGGINNMGYLTISIKNKKYLCHRIAMTYCYGVMPEQVDHINGNRADNRLVNLRSVNNYINSRNQKLRATNTSGHNGVYWCKRRNLWYVRVGVNGVNIHGGYFLDIEDAVSNRDLLDIKHGYHNLHGTKKGA